MAVGGDVATIRRSELGRDATGVRTLVVVVGVIVAALVVRANEGNIAEVGGALGRAHLLWLIPAIVVEIVSVGALAAQQRQLLSVQGDGFSLASVASTTVASTAISTSLPIVGSPASAMYSYRRFTALGASGVVAGWALVLSGLYSSLTLAGIVAVGGVLSGNLGTTFAGVATIAFAVVPLTFGVLGMQHRCVRRVTERTIILATRGLHRVVRRPQQSATSAVRGVQRVAALRLSSRAAARVALFSTLNWLMDIACLTCAVLALDGDVPWQKLVLVWAAGAGSSSLHLTPGGLGVVEAALTLALVGAGVSATLAFAAVLLYRVVSFWLVLGAGVGALCTRPLRRTPSREPATASVEMTMR